VFIFFVTNQISSNEQPEMNFFIAAYHSVFLYDEVNTRSLAFTKPPARHDVGSRLKWNVTTFTLYEDLQGRKLTTLVHHQQPMLE
jgi:hypothetical protein